MSENRILEVNQLSKRYRLGTISSGTLKQDISRWWAVRVMRRDDPLEKVDGVKQPANGAVWALKDINFTVNSGEAVGIIGRNGAGKSTLLKILSRITRPTRGYVKGFGRIASLLEVGTGFHEDLTGRENIYLNGNIMGMTRRQVDAKLEEIIDFAGISQYIDTPVKRYSSGMYVRLAFSVAAHLDTDILVVDEVLAVGDAEFQKKCLGKMREASRMKGRTVLFVSHNIQAVQNFCSRALWLDKGLLIADGGVKEITQQYISTIQKKEEVQAFDNPLTAPGNDKIRIRYAAVEAELNGDGRLIDVRTPVSICFEAWCMIETGLCIDVLLFNASGDCIFDAQSPLLQAKKGEIIGRCLIPGNLLNDGSYFITLIFANQEGYELFTYDECLHFDVEDYRENTNWFGKWWGHVRPKLEFQLQLKES